MFYLMSAVELVGVKFWFAHLKALEMRMRKLLLDLPVAQILPEKINKIFFPKKLGFMDVLSTRGFFFKCISEFFFKIINFEVSFLVKKEQIDSFFIRSPCIVICSVIYKRWHMVTESDLAIWLPFQKCSIIHSISFIDRSRIDCTGS